MKLQVLHRTKFAYRSPVRDSLNEVRLQPVETPEQQVHDFTLRVLPYSQPRHQFDFYHNHVHRFDVLAPHHALEVEATSVVSTSPPRVPGEATATLLASLANCLEVDLCYDFLQPSTYVDVDADVAALAAKVTGERATVWESVQALLTFTHTEFRYQPAVTNVHTRMSEALRLRQGVCQDFAHVMIGLCRALRIPARYVSGYLYNGSTGQLKGAQASHAWLETFIPGHGWFGFDPTNHQPTGERHVKVAVGRDYADVSPLRGTYRGTAERTLQVDVLATRLDEPPASTSNVRIEPPVSLSASRTPTPA